jgi:hypothetical protein
MYEYQDVSFPFLSFPRLMIECLGATVLRPYRFHIILYYTKYSPAKTIANLVNARGSLAFLVPYPVLSSQHSPIPSQIAASVIGSKIDSQRMIAARDELKGREVHFPNLRIATYSLFFCSLFLFTYLFTMPSLSSNEDNHRRQP